LEPTAHIYSQIGKVLAEAAALPGGRWTRSTGSLRLDPAFLWRPYAYRGLVLLAIGGRRARAIGEFQACAQTGPDVSTRHRTGLLQAAAGNASSRRAAADDADRGVNAPVPDSRAGGGRARKTYFARRCSARLAEIDRGETSNFVFTNREDRRGSDFQAG